MKSQEDLDWRPAALQRFHELRHLFLNVVAKFPTLENKMTIFRTTLLLFLLLISSPGATATAEPREKTLGLLEIPELFGRLSKSGDRLIPPKRKTTVLVRKDPHQKADLLVSVTNPEDLTARALRNEAMSVMVYSKKDSWYLIETSKGRGWAHEDDLRLFHSYEKLVEKGPSYLTTDWDQRLYEGALPQSPWEMIFLPADESQPSVKVLESRTQDDTLWFHVEVGVQPCGQNDKPGKKGWIPAHSNEGNPTVWFNSIACEKNLGQGSGS